MAMSNRTFTWWWRRAACCCCGSCPPSPPPHSSRRTYFGAGVRPDSWVRTMSEAEKIVGYPTSFGNLRWLMSDEVANVAVHLRKLVGTDHPILKTAKELFNSDKNNMQAWGLLVLLISKAAGFTQKAKKCELVEEGGILQSQRNYAEVTEMVKTGHSIHRALLNIREKHRNQGTENLVFGNKIALLTGDFLLAKANALLSSLRDPHLSALISSALRDLTESEYVGERDEQNMPIPSRPVEIHEDRPLVELKDDEVIASLTGTTRKCGPLDPSLAFGVAHREWTMRNVLGGGSLLGRGCEGALHLAGHDEEVQSVGYEFGCRVALAWQASVDLKTFSSTDGGEPFSLVGAPVMFVLQEDPTLYADLNRDTIDYRSLREAIKNGPALEMTLDLYYEYSMAAVKTLEENFPKTDATNVLKKIITSMQ